MSKALRKSGSRQNQDEKSSVHRGKRRVRALFGLFIWERDIVRGVMCFRSHVKTTEGQNFVQESRTITESQASWHIRIWNPSARVMTLGLSRKLLPILTFWIAILSLLVEWKQPGLDREMHHDPDRDRYSSDQEGTVIDNGADELELIAVSKRPNRLLSHATVFRTNLEPSVREATPLKKVWCVKLMDNSHAPEIISGQLNVIKTYLKARYQLSDLLRAQRNDKMTSNLKRWIENGAPDKGDLEEDSYKILKQFYLKRKGLLCLNKAGSWPVNPRKRTKSFTNIIL